jgi:preprotein translocase subunit SecY
MRSFARRARHQSRRRPYANDVRDWNWRKTLTWLGAAAYLYVGSRVPLPGLDVERLMNYWRENAGGGGLLGLWELLNSGGLHRGGVLALGIMPYLSARVYLWLSRFVVGDARWTHSRKITRYLTAALALAQSVGFAAFLRKVPGAVTAPGTFMTTTILTLTGASLIAMWFGEKLTEPDDPDELEHLDAESDAVLSGELPSGNFPPAKESPLASPAPDRVRR